jgi:hypothetical protein
MSRVRGDHPTIRQAPSVLATVAHVVESMLGYIPTYDVGDRRKEEQAPW